MSKDDYKGLRMTAPMTNECLLWLEDNYIGGLRHIDKGWFCGEVASWWISHRLNLKRISNVPICLTWKSQMRKMTPKLEFTQKTEW